MRLRSILLLFLSILIFLNIGYACIRINGITGSWKIIENNSTINLGVVGKGSILIINIDTKERSYCPPWDNWDRAWIENLSKKFIVENTSWYKIYFGPVTIKVPESVKEGVYKPKLCVEDQGTGKIECINLVFKVEKGNPKIDVKLKREFNTLILEIKNTGNVWLNCKLIYPKGAYPSRTKFYLPINHSEKIIIYPAKEGKYKFTVDCGIINKSVEYNFKRKILEVLTTTVNTKPGSVVKIPINTYPEVKIDISSELPLENLHISYFYISFKVPENIEPGNYNLTICGKDNNKLECKNIKINVNLDWKNICPFIHINIDKSKITLDSPKTVTLNVTLINDDIQKRKIHLNIYSDNAYIVYPKEIILKPKESKKIPILIILKKFNNTTIKVEIPECKKAKILTIVAITPKTHQLYPLLDINQPEVVVNPNFISVYPDIEKIKIKIYISNPNIERGIVCDCKIGEENIRVFKEFKTEYKIDISSYKYAGEYNYRIPIICTCGNKSYDLSKDVRINIKEVKRIIINPIEILINKKEGYKFISVKNEGNTPEFIEVINMCPVNISDYAFKLNPGESRKIYIYYHFDINTNKECYIIINNKKIKVKINYLSQQVTNSESVQTKKEQEFFVPIFFGFDIIFNNIF